MTLDSGTILSIISLLFTVCAIVFYAGSIPEQLKNHKADIKRIECDTEDTHSKMARDAERYVDALRREVEKAISEMQMSNLESTKRIHGRIDTLSNHLIGNDGAPVFVAKSECKEKRSDITDNTTNTTNMICTMLERVEQKIEKAMSDWSTALTNQTSMMNEIMLIKSEMKTFRAELNDSRRKTA